MSSRSHESQRLLPPTSRGSSDRTALPLHSVYDSVESRRALLSTGSSSSLSGGYGALGRRSKSGSYGSHSGSGAHRAASRLSDWQSSFHLVSYMTGSGMLCLPLALVEIDWYGVLLLLAAAVVSAYTSKILIEAMDVVRWSSGASVSYSDLGYECYGRAGRIFTGLLVHSCFLITCTGYLSLAASCIAGVTKLQTGTVLLLITAGVWLHVFVKSLKALAVFSALNVALAFWIEAVIFGDAMYPLKQIALDESAFEFETPDLSGASMIVKLSYSFTLLSSGFFCHSIVPTVYNAMDDYRQSTSVVAQSQLGVMALLYLPICVMTYAVYGDTLQAPLFFNMRNAFVRNMTIVLYCIHLLLSYTIALYPLQRAFESWVLKTSPCGGQPSSSSFTPLGVQASLSTGTITGAGGSTVDDTSARRMEFVVKLVSRTVLVLLTLFLSYFLMPSALDIFGYMLVPVTLLSLVLPAVFYWQICREEARLVDKVAVVGVLVIALVTLGCSLTVFIS